MLKKELKTPCILVDLDVLEHNIASYQALCNLHKKHLWPMIKTHKSTEVALMQQKAGASGFLCGTLDECEALVKAGVQNIMYAYPIAKGPSMERAIALSRSSNFIVRLDCTDNVRELNEAAEAAGVQLNYTAIVDSGLHRFGLPPDNIAKLVREISTLPNLVFKGISTHPGQVYGGAGKATAMAAAAQEKQAMAEAVKQLAAAGFTCEMVTSGSTPTFALAVDDPVISHYHPGNYVFLDTIQVSLEAASLAECSLSILASVISRPAMDRMIIDAGAKCFGLDQGAHGSGTIKGHGAIKGHPKLELYGLSEEVGKIHIDEQSTLNVGDRIEVIPNHSCSSANLTSYLVGCRGDTVERLIAVDMRSNSTDPRNV